jgi:hypothetical protein
MGTTPKKCIFCGGRPLTKEDVWPTWLTQYVPRDLPSYSDSVNTISASGEITTVRKKRSGDPRSRRAKCVCATCNSGWMSRLQERAKPIVLALVRGTETTLSVRDQDLLSAWATMSTITSEYFNPSQVAISARHRRRFWKTQRALKNWKIWIGNYRRGEWKPYRAHNAWTYVKSSRPRRKPPPPNTQTTTLVFGQLYLHVTSSEISNIIKRLAFPEPLTNTILKQIWPARTGTLRWPPRQTMNDRDADTVTAFLFLFHTGLLKKPPTPARGPDIRSI